MTLTLKDTPDWMQRMVNRTLLHYYGCGLDATIDLQASQQTAALLRGARYSARRKHPVWSQVLNELTASLPNYTMEDTSLNTYWYSYQVDVIPFKVTSSDSRGMIDAALSQQNSFVGLTIAVSTLCPLFYAQPYMAWRRADGVHDCRWVCFDEEQVQALDVWMPVFGQINLVMRSYGYWLISNELLLTKLQCAEAPEAANRYVKDCIFGEYTFGEVKRPFNCDGICCDGDTAVTS